MRLPKRSQAECASINRGGEQNYPRGLGYASWLLELDVGSILATLQVTVLRGLEGYALHTIWASTSSTTTEQK